MNSYTLEYDMTQSLWVLRDNADGRVLRAFLSRREATEGGLLRALVGPEACLRIRNADGSFERDLARVLGVEGPMTRHPGVAANHELPDSRAAA
ncbi:hypothetical protein [Luteimonas deserti]|uniref:Uncharacterized protein n=1 Tax=Luteimonas deserti TaxID=2752306 RepID=A0A7Z0TXD5_9GAMM|nr:hypothetical protein [Luteimonas deserti]NYZ61237.1 hypothetical protein [Luteimonas deserti]